MKLLEMELENFRQFCGTQRIEFAHQDPKRNITVFHGFNGSGKTSLLNAFVWCLYGETTRDLPTSDRLEYEGAIAQAPEGSIVVVAVTLRFEMHSEQYRVRREVRTTKGGADSLSNPTKSLLLWRGLRSGEWEPVEDDGYACQKRIEQMLPKSLYPFFFFNGERVEHLASPDAYDRVEAGVRTLLDIEIYDRGARHLRSKVATRLRTALKPFGDSDLSNKLEELDKNAAEDERLAESLKRHLEKLGALNEEISLLEIDQSAHEKTSALAGQRDEVKKAIERLELNVREARRDLARAVSSDGYLAFAASVLDSTDDLVQGARRRGDIPAKIKPQFVNDLVQNGMCICGRPIEPESPEAEHLHQWNDATGLAALEERISRASASVGHYRSRREAFFKTLEEADDRLQRAMNAQKQEQSRLDLLEEQLGDPTKVEDAAALQGQIDQRRKDRDEVNGEIAVCKSDITRLAERSNKLEGEIGKLRAQDARAQAIQRQLDAVSRVASALEEITAIQKEDVRASLDSKIREIWHDAAIKDYEASISDQYRLRLTKRVGQVTQPVVGASTGEKQVLALSFVAALVNKARENYRRSGKAIRGVNVGGQYPLIMDSPFGSLEDEYRAKVAEWLPTLADQVIVMASNSQWRGEVESAMRPRIGAEYVLELHTLKRGASRKIEVEGRAYDYVVSSHEPVEKTIIRRIGHEG